MHWQKEMICGLSLYDEIDRKSIDNVKNDIMSEAKENQNHKNVELNAEYLSLKEAACFLKISISKMQKMSANRLLPIFKPTNGKVYFSKTDLLNYISAGRICSQQEITNSINFN